MWKGKPIGDGTPFETERALQPCEFNSRSFRLVNDECAIGRAAKVLDFQSGQVGSTPTWHSVSSSNLQVWANGKPAAFEAVHWRFESFRLCLWDRHLACQCRSRMTSWKLIPQTNQYSGVATVGRCVWL